MNIILTRQPAQAGRMEAGLAALGHDIGFMPLTDFQLPAITDALDELITGLHAGAWDRLLLTSPNTIRALVARGWDPARTQAHTRFAVTGPGTARVLAQFGATQTPWMPTDDASAAGILAQFPSGPGTLALPQAAAAGAAMSDGLRAKGWDVTHVVAYDTVAFPADPTRALLPAPTGILRPHEVTAHDILVLTAPSAARRWAALEITGPKLIALGQPTRRAAAETNLTLFATATSPDAPGIADVLPRS